MIATDIFPIADNNKIIIKSSNESIDLDFNTVKPDTVSYIEGDNNKIRINIGATDSFVSEATYDENQIAIVKMQNSESNMLFLPNGYKNMVLSGLEDKKIPFLGFIYKREGSSQRYYEIDSSNTMYLGSIQINSDVKKIGLKFFEKTYGAYQYDTFDNGQVKSLNFYGKSDWSGDGIDINTGVIPYVKDNHSYKREGGNS